MPNLEENKRNLAPIIDTAELSFMGLKIKEEHIWI
jgi:hypothetical protein